MGGGEGRRARLCSHRKPRAYLVGWRQGVVRRERCRVSFCFSCVSNRKMSLGYRGSRDGNGINTARPPARSLLRQRLLRETTSSTGGWVGAVALLYLTEKPIQRPCPPQPLRFSPTSVHNLKPQLLQQSSPISIRASAKTHTRVPPPAYVEVPLPTTLGSLPHAVYLFFSLRFDGTLDTKAHHPFSHGRGGKKVEDGRRTPLYSSSFTRRMKQARRPYAGGGRYRSTSLTPSLSAIDDCHSYDSATAKHELVYDGVDTDVYVEDLQSGSQEVRGEGKERRLLSHRRRIERIVAQFWTLFPFFVGWARVGQARQAEAETERQREEYQGRRRRRCCAAVLRFSQSENIYNPKIPHSPRCSFCTFDES